MKKKPRLKPKPYRAKPKEFIITQAAFQASCNIAYEQGYNDAVRDTQINAIWNNWTCYSPSNMEH